MGGKSARTKGGGGEREIATMLNNLISDEMSKLGYAAESILDRMPMVQRNQNQTAVGGQDLINTFGLAIEVKRRETLNVTGWWRQTVNQCPPGQLAVLIYRQNRKAWKIRTYAWSAMPEGEGDPFVCQIELPVFKKWFRQWVQHKLTNVPEANWHA